jgi:hypothetical protein
LTEPKGPDPQQLLWSSKMGVADARLAPRRRNAAPTRAAMVSFISVPRFPV